MASAGSVSRSAPSRNEPTTVLSGVLERIKFFNEENHFCIGEFRPEEARETVIITGNLPGVQCGETLRLEGVWTRHPVHGTQFKIARFESRLPASVHGIRKYLGSGLVSGIGPKYADRIVDKFGESTLEVISNESGRLREVQGIGKQRAQAIKKAWDEQQALREVMIFLQTYGVGTARCLRLVKQYGSAARRILETEPYKVAGEVDGIGFKTADRIALNLGFRNEGDARIDAGILYAVSELEGEGNTAVAPERLKSYTAELLGVGEELVAGRINALVQRREILYSASSGIIQSPSLDHAESAIAECLARTARTRSGLPPILLEKALAWAQERAGFAFADNQAQAIRAAVTEKACILTGGPGTGKTTILRALVDILRAKKVRLVLAAPTGRAAQRMAETTRHSAQTIHRLLKYDPQRGGFTHNSETPLHADFVIVDEASMLDVRLAASLLRAVPPAAHLLLVGDAEQLPSVGPGNVLKDLIQSERLSVTRLDRIFRQQARSGIVTAAHGLLGGQTGAPQAIEDVRQLDLDRDLHFIRAENPEDCAGIIEELCSRQLPARLAGIDRVMDIQVLAPLHKGIGGTGNLNTLLQQSLNSEARSVTLGRTRFGVGDKVQQTRNNYDKYIFNGDFGRVTAVNPEAGTLAASFEGREHDFERGEMTDLQLAYAVSVHKSQGSEFPVVVLPLLKQHFVMLQRNLLYTAITRGRRKVIVVGDPAAWSMAARNAEAAGRVTGLRRKLEDALG